MAVTPNYSWPVPDDTDLVKDGAEAIRDLGNAIDTTVDGLPGAGLVHINRTTFSAVSSVSIDNVFDASFEHYKVLLFISSVSTDQTTLMRFRVGGNDTSTSTYRWNFPGLSPTLGATSMTIMNVTFNQTATFNMDIFNPAIAATNTFVAGNIHTAFSTTTFRQSNDFIGQQTDNAAFDGFSAISSTGNMTGVVSTFGWNTL